MQSFELAQGLALLGCSPKLGQSALAGKRGLFEKGRLAEFSISGSTSFLFQLLPGNYVPYLRCGDKMVDCSSPPPDEGRTQPSNLD